MVKGAGILLYRQRDGLMEVLLGRRRYSPDKGSWSIPGGRMEDCDRGDFMDCAIRETCEEFFGSSPQAEALLRESINTLESTTFHIPLLYHYRIYMIHLASDIEVCHNHEFHETGWFPVQNLPRNTQGGVRYALKKMKQLNTSADL